MYNVLATRQVVVPTYLHDGLTMYLCACLLLVVTNSILNITQMRYYWRRYLLYARICGLMSFLFFIIWPIDTLLIGIGISFSNGFVDPRFHWESFHRNPSHFFVKATFSWGAMLHHVGVTLLTKEYTMWLFLDSTRTFWDTNITFVILCICELTSWSIDIAVLMRRALPWFKVVDITAKMLQVVCIIAAILWMDVPTTLFSCIVVGTGSLVNLIGELAGVKVSTWEIPHPRKMSIPRDTHRKSPLSSSGPLTRFVQQLESANIRYDL